MKRKILITLCLAIACMSFAACGKTQPAESKLPESASSVVESNGSEESTLPEEESMPDMEDNVNPDDLDEEELDDTVSGDMLPDRENVVPGSTEEMMMDLYESLADKELPVPMITPIDAEMSEMFVGVSADRYKEATSGDAAIGSIAHSVCIVRANDEADVEDLKKDIEENIDPRKWICVEAEKVIVDSVGENILVVMSDAATADLMHEAFLSLE